MKLIKIKDFLVGPSQPLTVICGPCVIESREHALAAAQFLTPLMKELGIQFIYKSSYDKANRSSYHSFRGPGIKEGLAILSEIRSQFDVPILTDVHSPEEAEIAGEICDVIQIPAFLCRQTDLITAAGRSKAAIKVKKGQFMSPWEMRNVIDKILAAGNDRIILTDRGTSFGYNNLVTDIRAIPIMKSMGFPVCFDATHSTQLPGGAGDSSGGQRQFVPTLAKAAIAAGSDCLYIEAHPEPALAKSDKETVYPFSELKQLLQEVLRIYEVAHV